MSVLNNLSIRLKTKNNNLSESSFENNNSLNQLKNRLQFRGGTDQWTRMRQDKLRSLKKALLYSYQSAVVQQYSVKKNGIANNLISIITLLQNQQALSDNQLQLLTNIQEEYDFSFDLLDQQEKINKIQEIVDTLTQSQPCFRCLINHDKLKVDYEDKIISIPFQQPPVGETVPIETNFHNGTVFKWIHGNKEEWTPDTYWIVYMQYSEETAYFRAEIRKADEQIQIVTIDNEGNESTATYRGWMTGPNETIALWNTKRNVTWNDLNYTKLLYITKDEDTLAFFQRFDRVIINGKPWEVQAYNQNYSTSKSAGVDSGIIRVALKETYTSTDQFVKQKLEEQAATKQAKAQYNAIHTEPRIDGPAIVKPYSTITFTAKNFVEERDEYGKIINAKHWSLYGTPLARIIKTSVDGKTITVEVLTGVSNKKGFYVNYGDSQDTILNVVIESF